MFSISIPHPCKEDWNKMTVAGNGRYCDACSTIVTDFSVMTDEEVQQYFVTHYQQRICGRFKNEQLERIVINLPETTLFTNMPLWKKVMIAAMLIFGASIFPFETTVAGYHPQQYLQANQPHQKKSRIIRKQPAKRSAKKRLTTYLKDLGFHTTGIVYIPPKYDLKSQTSYLISDPVFFADKTTVTAYDKRDMAPDKKPVPMSAPVLPECILPVPLAIKKAGKKET